MHATDPRQSDQSPAPHILLLKFHQEWSLSTNPELRSEHHQVKCQNKQTENETYYIWACVCFALLIIWFEYVGNSCETWSSITCSNWFSWNRESITVSHMRSYKLSIHLEDKSTWCLLRYNWWMTKQMNYLKHKG